MKLVNTTFNLKKSGMWSKCLFSARCTTLVNNGPLEN
jgi:hypothetical protein